MHPTRIFKSPEELLQAWEGYKDWLLDEAQKWPKVQYVGKDGERVTDFPVLPYTLEGFKRYCRNHHGEVEHYFSNTGNYYDDFCGICSRVREEIREHQITGGMLGQFNPSITQRLNGLVDKSQVDVREQPMFPDSDDENTP